MTKARKVIHVELKEPYNGRRNYYFGSAKAIYNTLPTEIVGIGLGSLWNWFSKSNTYTGSLATIRKRDLITTPTNRGKKGSDGYLENQ